MEYKLTVEKEVKTVVKEEKEVTLAEYIGYNIKKFRKLKGISQEKLGEEIGILKTSVWNIESGKNTVTLKRFSKICEVLGVKSSDILPF